MAKKVCVWNFISINCPCMLMGGSSFIVIARWLFRSLFNLNSTKSHTRKSFQSLRFSFLSSLLKHSYQFLSNSYLRFCFIIVNEENIVICNSIKFHSLCLKNNSVNVSILNLHQLNVNSFQSSSRKGSQHCI